MRNAQKTQWLAAGILLAVLPALPAHAARQTELQIDHTDGHVRIIVDGDPRTSAGVPLADNPTVAAGKDSTVSVTITNPNPLLFVYTVRKGTPTKTSDQVELEKFANLGLGPLLGMLKPATAGEDGERAFTPHVRLCPGSQSSSRRCRISTTLRRLALKSSVGL